MLPFTAKNTFGLDSCPIIQTTRIRYSDWMYIFSLTLLKDIQKLPVGTSRSVYKYIELPKYK